MPHPQLDAERVRPGHAQWLIVEGLCTWRDCLLNCAEGGFAGWACPCCGSAYDLSGRIRRGPAPRNLGVPRYQFVGEGAVRFV
jgi:ubiquinol-cytochrome c reductase iron-sulfur subunit